MKIEELKRANGLLEDIKRRERIEEETKQSLIAVRNGRTVSSSVKVVYEYGSDTHTGRTNRYEISLIISREETIKALEKELYINGNLLKKAKLELSRI